MEISDLFRNILEFGFGILFLVGAVFNAFYTLWNGEEFYGSFADKAVLAPAKQVIQKVVIPQNKVFTILMIAFQLIVAFCILSRGALVEPGLIAGAVFAFAAVFVSNTAGVIANFTMSIALLYLGIN